MHLHRIKHIAYPVFARRVKMELRQLKASTGRAIYKGTIHYDFDIRTQVLELCSAGIIRHREVRDCGSTDNRHCRIDDDGRLVGAFITDIVCAFIQPVPVQRPLQAVVAPGRNRNLSFTREGRGFIRTIRGSSAYSYL